jgi:Cu(I)/Ag(I) efflux system membrane fusion protein
MDLVPADEDGEDLEDEDHSEHDHSSMKIKNDSSKQNADNTNHQQPNDRATVKLKLDKQQIIGVKTNSVKRKTLFENIKAPGRIAFDPELYTAQSEYLEALRQQRKVRNSPLADIRRSTDEMVRSSKTRLQVLGLGNSEIKTLAKKGRVSDGLIVSGNNDNLIYADVFESDLAKIKPGQKVKIRASFIPGEPLKGEVVSVDQLIDPKTRSGKVRIKIDETKLSIRPEAFVTVEISVPLGDHIAIPLEAILDTGKDIFVFVKQGKGKFEPRIITKLFETDEYIAVLNGLSVDEEVVTSANFMIDSESRLKAVIKGASSSSGHNH